MAAMKARDRLVTTMLEEYQQRRDHVVAKKAAHKAAAIARDEVYESLRLPIILNFYVAPDHTLSPSQVMRVPLDCRSIADKGLRFRTAKVDLTATNTTPPTTAALTED